MLLLSHGNNHDTFHATDADRDSAWLSVQIAKLEAVYRAAQADEPRQVRVHPSIHPVKWSVDGWQVRP